jgi:signal transduction histidine kinase/ligand-binding sensor domain-containing protein/DNA-binding response OmpR family regulator
LLICETQAINNLKPLFSIIKQALMFRSYFTLILSFCLAAIICAGQPNQYFKKIDNKQGLSQNGIFAIFQDKDGYMWFGTHYGLNRYDGFTFKTFYRGDSCNDLCGNTIQSILQDSVGNIWIATLEGISVFNPVTEKFYNLNKYSPKESIFTHTILSMKLIDGKILASSKDGLWEINTVKSLFTDAIAKKICAEINNCKLQSTIKLEAIKVYKKDKYDNYLLIANNHVIISKIVDKKLSVIDEIVPDNISDIEVTVIYKDNYSNLWAGTANHGLFQIKESKGLYTTLKVSPKNPNTSFSRITDILQDEKNDLWVTTRGNGVFVIPKEGLEKNNLLPVKISDSEIPSNKIKSIYQSRDNTLWLGSLGSGVFYKNTAGIKFKNYQITYDANKLSVISPNNYIRSITKDAYNRLWLGTLFEGLYIYDLEKRKSIKFLLKNLSIFALSEIDKTHFLAGTSDGLYLITYNKENITAEKQFLGNGIQGTIFSICNKSKKYWIGTSKKLISFVLTDNYKISQLSNYENKLLQDYQFQNTVRCIKFDSKLNCIWVGLEMSGLVKVELDKNDNVSKFISINQEFKDKTISKYICDIYLDSANNYWIGTRNGLINFQTNTSGKIFNTRVFSTQNGFPSNLIQSIQSDKTGSLWVGTNRGLVKFNKLTHEIIHYDINDGIQDYEFAEHASYMDDKAVMYFGGINGVSEFSPKYMNYDNFIEPVVIQNIFINGFNANYKRELNNSNKLILLHSENNLKFNFIVFNYINPIKCKYAYMLEGFDKDWIYTTSDIRMAEYVDLPKGNYIFKVKASNEDGVWNTTYTSMHLEIRPSFWGSIYAVLLYFLILIGLVIMVASITKKRVQNKNKVLLEKQYREQIEKVNESKLQFFINISHEIRTPLTLIICSVERLIVNLKLNKEQKKEALGIEKNVIQMLSLTNELLEIQKIEIGNYQLSVRKSDIVIFLRNILVAFESLAIKQNIKLSLKNYQPEFFIWYDANALAKVFNNLISNAIKYTKNGGTVEVLINPSESNEFLEISVIDNGVGIDKDNLLKIFDRFYHKGGNKDSYEKGFGIGLSLAKSLIEVHKGFISVTSKPGFGSKFITSLPLKDDVYLNEEKADNVILKSDFTNVLRSVEYQNIINEPKVFLNKQIDELDPTKAIILYVDDNLELLENIRNYLSETYNVIIAPNGKIGVELANQYQPDVIISDIVMPLMDGFELCNVLKTDLNTSHIPIILLTARADSSSQLKGIETGADNFIPKPFNIKLLGLTIKNLIDSREKLRQLFTNNQFRNPKEITTNTKDAEFLEKLIKYVEDHIGEPELNINNLAQTLAMSRSTFFRKIKAITGNTGKDFVDTIRLKKAAQLLLNSGMNISEVAYTIGHSNPQYFSKWFKAYYKVSPSEYILQHKNTH